MQIEFVLNRNPTSNKHKFKKLSQKSNCSPRENLLVPPPDTDDDLDGTGENWVDVIHGGVGDKDENNKGDSVDGKDDDDSNDSVDSMDGDKTDHRVDAKDDEKRLLWCS